MANDLYTGNAHFGRQGFRKVTSSGGAKVTETYYVLTPIGGSATVTATCENGDNLTALAIDVPIYGRFTNVSVSSGTILAYIHA